MYNVFDTIGEASAAQEYDFGKFMLVHDDNNGYTETTTCWDSVRQRLDGKAVYRVCPYSDRVHNTEEDDGTWFPVEE